MIQIENDGRGIKGVWVNGQRVGQIRTRKFGYADSQTEYVVEMNGHVNRQFKTMKAAHADAQAKAGITVREVPHYLGR